MAEIGTSLYTTDMGDIICAKLAEGMTLRAICKQPGMPPSSTVRHWVIDDRDGFAARYTRARQVGYEQMADEVIDEARTPRIGIKKKEKADGSVEYEEGDAVQRSHLHVETLKWFLAKALPKIYGEKSQLVSAVDENGKTFVVVVPGKAKDADAWVASTQPG